MTRLAEAARGGQASLIRNRPPDPASSASHFVTSSSLLLYSYSPHRLIIFVYASLPSQQVCSHPNKICGYSSLSLGSNEVSVICRRLARQPFRSHQFLNTGLWIERGLYGALWRIHGCIKTSMRRQVRLSDSKPQHAGGSRLEDARIVSP